MQVNDLVKVKAGEHEGRAGVVEKVEAGQNTVKLDATTEKDEAHATFEDGELEFLGR